MYAFGTRARIFVSSRADEHHARLPMRLNLPVHDHGTISKTSWVYYLEVGESPSPLTFPIINHNNYGETNIVDQKHLPVYNDCIIMFPSLLPHFVKPCETTRYIIAGNINNIIYKEPQ